MTTFADQVGVARRSADHIVDAATYRMWDAHLDRELTSTEKLTALAHGATFVFAEALAGGSGAPEGPSGRRAVHAARCMRRHASGSADVGFPRVRALLPPWHAPCSRLPRRRCVWFRCSTRC